MSIFVQYVFISEQMCTFHLWHGHPIHPLYKLQNVQYLSFICSYMILLTSPLSVYPLIVTDGHWSPRPVEQIVTNLLNVLQCWWRGHFHICIQYSPDRCVLRAAVLWPVGRTCVQYPTSLACTCSVLSSCTVYNCSVLYYNCTTCLSSK